MQTGADVHFNPKWPENVTNVIYNISNSWFNNFLITSKILFFIIESPKYDRIMVVCCYNMVTVALLPRPANMSASYALANQNREISKSDQSRANVNTEWKQREKVAPPGFRFRVQTSNKFSVFLHPSISRWPGTRRTTARRRRRRPRG